ncbi:Het-C-domain-containing protein [Lentinus brumalis]|uniref:Het-C-domain-containing protein n=1 Tax=Lentinus brumalis TaxID=2498619 RepID=A0A371DHG9_9APHY|nr:Het-C-domain-containing protein [Polyporus brumalis]
MHSLTTTLLVLTVLLVLLPSETYAFGAGDIPDFAYLNGKAFRHGDIENILTELAKSVGHASGGGGLLGFAQSVMSAAASGGGGATFSKEDVKRVYFGNWLRDYSQAMDIAGLSKLSADTLVLIVSVLGFLTFGFATEEFQVTPDRLGVYLPTEHIDNPKGYAEKEGDARQFHPKLRPPVNPEELEIDERTGMKNYMASENRGWDTSTALIRRTFRACIEHGRRAGGREGADLWEAYRLMGTGLHTMEDLLAHSNWCELALRKLGYNDVFCHVGDNVLIDSPNGRTHPLVTGTFGSADFLHSLMGEATDHLSQASVVDLSKKMDEATNQDNDTIGNLRALISKLPIGGGDDEKMGEADDMQAKAQAYNFDPDNIAPPEVQEQLWQLLKWRDDIYRDIIKKIEMVPGLSDLIENLTNALNAFVYAILAPYVAPILKQVTEVLTEGSKAVIDTEDQYQVFDDPNASDPSHSLLSKDHFALILNEPAGKIALVVVQHSVKLLVQAWSDNSDADRVIDEILEAFHHPYYATGRSRIQQEMFQALQNWVTSLENVDETIQALSKESVRAGKNKRQGSDDDMANSNQEYGGRITQSSGGGQYASSQSQGYGSTGGYGSSESRQYGGNSDVGGYGGSRRDEYGQSEEPRRKHRQQEGSGNDSRRQEEPSYGRESGYGDDQSSYGRREEPSYGRREEPSYGRREEPSYGRSEEPSYGRSEEPSYGRSEEPSYGRREEPSYERREEPSNTYGGEYGGARREEESYESRTSYGEEERPPRHHAQGGFGGEERREEYDGGRGARGGNEYEAPRRDEGFGGGRREERSEYGRAEGSYGEGYAPSYGRGGDQLEGFGRRGEEGGYAGGSGDDRRGFGGDGGYGRSDEPRGYGGDGGETYGVEGLSLGEERRHHGGHRHKRDDSD